MPHYRLVLLSFMCLAVLRITWSRLIPTRFGSQLAATTVTALLPTVAVFYYGLVLIGLCTRGQFISLNLIASYSTQLPDLADAIGISTPLTLSALIFGYSLLLPCEDT